MKLSARIMTAMLALVLLTSAAVGLLTYRNLEAAILPIEFERLESHTQGLATELNTYVQHARADLLMLAATPAMDGILQAHAANGVDPRDGTSEAVWRERLAGLFKASQAAVPEYVQFRLIGVAEGGRELVRVDQAGASTAIRLIGAAQLQPKAGRDYFKEALQIPPGQVYVSPIGLNQEQGGIQKPLLPALRVVTRVNDTRGQPFGILIINLDMRPAFARLRAATRKNHNIYLINEHGDFLVHPQPEREFGHELGRPFLVQDDFAELIGVEAARTTTVKRIRTATGQPLVVAVTPLRLLDRLPVVLLETVPSQELLSATASVRQSSLLAGSVATLAAVLLALVLTRSLTKPLVKMTAAVDAFRGDEPLEVPSDTGGELGVLARAFSRMSVEVQRRLRLRSSSVVAPKPKRNAMLNEIAYTAPWWNLPTMRSCSSHSTE